MKKKYIVLLCVGFLVGIGIYGISSLKPQQVNKQNKEISIQIIDMHEPEKVLFDEVVSCENESLGDFFDTQDQITVEIEESEYGAYIVSMMGQASDNEYFWVYESENNQTCLDLGMCPAIDECILEDGDQFIFKLTNKFE